MEKEINLKSRYSPILTSTSTTTTTTTTTSSSIIRGPSSIYTSTTASVLGGGTYTRDVLGSSSRLTSSLTSPRKSIATTTTTTTTTSSYLPTSSPITTSRVTSEPLTYSRSSRMTTILSSSDSYRSRSHSPSLSTSLPSSNWRPATSVTTSAVTLTTSSYRSRSTFPDLDSSYSIDKDPVVAAISERLSRESSLNGKRSNISKDYSSRPYTSSLTSNNDPDHNKRSHNRTSASTLNNGLYGLDRSEYFNNEEKRFLASVSKMVNNSHYTPVDKNYPSDRSICAENMTSRTCLQNEAISRHPGLMNGSLLRSNSFQEMRDFELAGISTNLASAMAARDRHKTLAYGVSVADLAMVPHLPITTCPHHGHLNIMNSSQGMESKFRSNQYSDYEQSASVEIRGPGSANPLNGFKSDMSIAEVAVNGIGGKTTKSEEEENSEKAKNEENLNYKKLWEETQLENAKLRDDLDKVSKELENMKQNAEEPQPSSGLSDREKREKMALEKKLAEMEEELKLLALSENLTDQQLEHLKNDNQRLRDENGALIRVISKLSK